MTSSPLRLALAQLNTVVGDIDANCERMLLWAQRAHQQLQAQLIVYPELALSGYPPEDLLLRPGLKQRIKRALTRLMAQLPTQLVAVVGLPWHQNGRLYNAAVVLQGGAQLACYHKHRLPNYSVFDEQRYFAAGDQPCLVRLGDFAIGISICEDVWFRAPVVAAAQAGADVILALNASPYHHSKRAEREQVVAARVHETGVPMVYLNAVGGQDELVFDGSSFVMNPGGSAMHCAPAFQESLAVVQVDQARRLSVEQAATMPDTLESIYSALVLGVHDYVQKNGFQGAVIGLSGGIDSALTLALAVDALGAEQVEAVLMPSRYTAEISVIDAQQQARELQVRHSLIAIEAPFQALLDALADRFEGYAHDTTEENLQARCRGMILMAISNKTGRIVLTTGNKSELAVGYATLYGDMAGGFAPLKDVPKTMVYALAKWRNRHAVIIPERVIERPPSAELAPDQVDADSLPPYEILDAIMQRYVEDDYAVADIIAEGYERSDVERVVSLIVRNEYKRRQAPPGVRISPRAFGRDRRYPITSGYGW